MTKRDSRFFFYTCSIFFILFLAACQLWASFLPMFGHFGSYQAVNAMMAEMFGYRGFISFFEPRAMTIMNNQPALHLLYVPYGAWLARITQLFLRLDVDFLGFLGRLYSLLAVMVSARLLYLIFLRLNPGAYQTALWTVLLYLFSPRVSVIAASFQNEAWALLFIFSSLFSWSSKKQPYLSGFLAGIFFALALTARIHFAYFIIPILFWPVEVFQKSMKRVLVFIAGASIPILLWLGWFYFLEVHYGGALTSLFSQAGEGRIAAKSLFFSREFYVHLFRQGVLFFLFPGVWFFVLLILKKGTPAIIWLGLLASISVIVLLPQKVLDHPFYLIGSIPLLALLTAPAIEHFFESKAVWMRLLFLTALAAYGIAAFLHIQKLSPEVSRWHSQAACLRNATSPEDKLVMQHSQAAAMLFYAHRLGWEFDLNMDTGNVMKSSQKRHSDLRAVGYGDNVTWLNHLVAQGAKWLIVATPDQFAEKKEFVGYVNTHYHAMSPAPCKDVLIYDLKPVIQ